MCVCVCSQHIHTCGYSFTFASSWSNPIMSSSTRLFAFERRPSLFDNSDNARIVSDSFTRRKEPSALYPNPSPAVLLLRTGSVELLSSPPLPPLPPPSPPAAASLELADAAHEAAPPPPPPPRTRPLELMTPSARDGHNAAAAHVYFRVTHAFARTGLIL